jgi:hypothetical protein
MRAEEGNFGSLARINRELIGALASPQRVVLDMDSTEIPVYGQLENSAYNGHFESTCYHLTRCCCSIARATVWRRSWRLGVYLPHAGCQNGNSC